MKATFFVEAIAVMLVLIILFSGCTAPTPNPAGSGGVTVSEVKVVDGIPRIFLNGQDSITAINDVHYFYNAIESQEGKSYYADGAWLIGIKQQIDGMKSIGANTIILNLWWPDLDTSSIRPASIAKSLNFVPLDEAMKYAQEKGVYVIIPPMLHTALPTWLRKENNITDAFGPFSLCIPQEADSNVSCIPKEICGNGDTRCCTQPKEDLYCCNTKMDTAKAAGAESSPINFTSDGRVVCRAVTNNQHYKTNTLSEIDSYGWEYNYPSFGGKQFKQDYAEYLTAIIERYKNNPAFIGWWFSLGPTGEDGYLDYPLLRVLYSGGSISGSSLGKPKTDQVFGYSENAQASFKGWIKTRYSSDKELQEAWDDNTLKIDEGRMPNANKVFNQGKENEFPDDFSNYYIVSIDALTQQGKDLYDFMEYMRAADRDYYTKLFKTLDSNHVLIYQGSNNEGIYKNPYIDAIVTTPGVGLTKPDSANFAFASNADQAKNDKASIWGVESAHYTSANQITSQTELMVKTEKTIKCSGGYIGYSSEISEITKGTVPSWTENDITKAITELIAYQPEINCICSLVPSNGKAGTHTIQETVQDLGLEKYYNCDGATTVQQQIPPDKNTNRAPPSGTGVGQGKCGDGICQDIEKQNDVCPADCN